MALTRTTYVNTELVWAEEQLASWKAYIDANPMHTLEDRINYKETKAGGVIPMVIASKEDQLKSIAMIMEKLPKMLQALDELRQKEEDIKQTLLTILFF